ncbi:hypothetical protein FA15DRAFT_664435 [Coprinopsis marcescibilis]|uniref:Uncharacterized protein n=1 Tax=Coprinopsis marcescibilis TaxID=230819 RepID=A0A5C3L8N2_COPMA|nr:hypothetical protein FA15DRAFT_664435 [Coprinopsis marcescibilis]
MSCHVILFRSWRHKWLLKPRQPHCQRCQFGTSTSPVDRSRQKFISATVRRLQEGTNDGVWSLISLLGSQKGTQLSALQHTSVPFRDYLEWKSILGQQPLKDIVSTIPNNSKKDADSSSTPDSATLPEWLVLHILAHRVQTYGEATDMMMDILRHNLPLLPIHLKPPALIFSAAHLASRNLLVPLKTVVDEFLSLGHPILCPTFPSSSQGPELSSQLDHNATAMLSMGSNASHELHYNLFLSALAFTPKHSTAYSNYVISVIKRLGQVSHPEGSESTEPFVKIHPDTYSALLFSTPAVIDHHSSFAQDQLLSPYLLGFLRSQMALENFTPLTEHHEAFLRFWRKEAVHSGNWSSKRASKGRHMVEKSWEAVQASVQSDEETTRIEIPNDTSNPAIRANTLYLGSQQRTDAMKTVFKTLTTTSSPPDTELPDTHEAQLPAKVIRKKDQIDIYDVSAALHSAANERTLSTYHFIKLFHQLTNSPVDSKTSVQLNPTLATYTILLRGLVFRRSFNQALKYWEFLINKSGLQLDRMSITIGAQIWTRCGRPHEAFDLLERFAWRPHGAAPREYSHSLGFRKSVRLGTISVNEWMVSLKRAGRPDAAVQLWDHMFPLYGVLQTNETLNIMLQSTRMAVLMNERSVRTQISRYFKLQRKRLAGKGDEQSGFVLDAGFGERARSAEAMYTLLGHPDYGGPKPYHGGLWRDKRPEDTAREIFLQVLFGMEQDSTCRRLADVQAPARAVRQGWDSDGGISGLGVALPSLKMERFKFQPGREVYRWVPSSPDRMEPRPHYPHIVLNNSNFFNYLCLLAVTNRTVEVALTMAWMRHLGLKPSESTLAVAMVLWGEVSVEGPVVQGLSNLKGRSKGDSDGLDGGTVDADHKRVPGPVDEYERFVAWLEDWVGSERIPDVVVMRRWRMVIKSMREAGVDSDRR